VSWLVPEITLLVTTAPGNVAWHGWPVVACGGMSIGHKGLVFASKALAMTMVDLFENEQLRNSMRTEFEKRKNGQVYKAYIPDGPPPVPAK
jgi:aminobenzoyl-glutamate utilization protein B